MAKTEGFPVSSVSGNVSVLGSPGCNEERPDGSFFILPLVGIQRWLSFSDSEVSPFCGAHHSKGEEFLALITSHIVL